MAKVGITAGAFDLTHAGHYLMFAECKSHCDFLIVLLQTDPTIDRSEKNRPVQSLEERRIQLLACRYIDKVVVYDTEEDLLFLFKKLKPDIRFIGADWKGKQYTGKDLNILTMFNSRNHSYSSSSLRQRIYEAENSRINVSKITEHSVA